MPVIYLAQPQFQIPLSPDMGWQHHNPASGIPLYWLKVPQNVAFGMRSLGFHFGYTLRDGVDIGLEAAFQPDQSDEDKSRCLATWASFIDRESSLLNPGYSTLWHPHICDSDINIVRRHFGKRLIEIEANSLEDAIHLFRLTAWKLGVFYHVACIGDWKTVVIEQLGLLGRVDLRYIYVSFLGSDNDLKYFTDCAQELDICVDFIYVHSDFKMFEVPMFKLIHSWAKAHPENYLLYFHTKGVSNTNDSSKVKWRRLMHSFVIEIWRENVQKLREGIDVIGVNWLDLHLISHFPGNFWMSRASYISDLPDFSEYYRNPRHHIHDSIDQCRLSAEFWIGSGNCRPRIHSFVSKNERMHLPKYWLAPRAGTMGYLALCLWCKDENSYLKEWLDYHFLIGVEHVFIIDNGSARPLREDIKEYIAQGKVTLIVDESTCAGRQCAAYIRVLKEYGVGYEWMGFIDTDEYIVPKNSGNLVQFLKPYECYGGIGVFWYCFGSNGHVTRTNSVIHSYTMRTNNDYGYNNYIKSIVRPRAVLLEQTEDPHHFHYKDGFGCVDETGAPILAARRECRVSSLIQLNHYITRSQEEWREKFYRGDGNGICRSWQFLSQLDAESLDCDTEILKVMDLASNDVAKKS